MRPKHVLAGLATALTLVTPAAAQAPPAGDPPAPPERVMGERPPWSGQAWRGHRHHPGWGRPLLSMMLHHRQELGLTPTQVESLERLRTDFMRDAIRRRADQQLARVDLMTLMRPDPADPGKAVDLAKVDAKIHELAQMRADFAVARIKTIEAGKALLTPEQRTKLAALLAAHRGRGPMMHGPMAPSRG